MTIGVLIPSMLKLRDRTCLVPRTRRLGRSHPQFQGGRDDLAGIEINVCPAVKPAAGFPARANHPPWNDRARGNPHPRQPIAAIDILDGPLDADRRAQFDELP